MMLMKKSHFCNHGISNIDWFGTSLSWRKNVIEPQKYNCQVSKPNIKTKILTYFLSLFKGAQSRTQS